MATERYLPTIGLEVHCELSTTSKLWCPCPNYFGAEPNTLVCPVCLGLPGSLPVLNGKALRLAIATGLALNCEIRDCVFHRKNYFYPDLPKNYQISQYDRPLAVGGYLELPSGGRVGIIRAHLEEDTGKAIHASSSGRIDEAEVSYIDFNRSGVPLMEIVTAPDIRSPEQAKEFVAELRLTLKVLGVSDTKMEEGSLRVDANVSVAPEGAADLGTRCEIKNLNSLRSLQRALEYEIGRQTEILAEGGRIAQETRHWNESAGRTEPLRSKEEVHDYRYFPEPDLVPVHIETALLEEVQSMMTGGLRERRDRLARAIPGIGRERADAVIEEGLDGYLLDVVAAGAPPELVGKRVAGDLLPELAARTDQLPAPDRLAEVLRAEAEKKISAQRSRELCVKLAQGEEVPKEALAPSLPEAVLGLEEVVEAVIRNHPGEWQRYLQGEDKVLQFLIGQVMRETKGKADGSLVRSMFEEKASRHPEG
jgi:aspartyl-tRNA(Asn)/glutamyl-tRNA(Gln) amidotransferase subunit B